MSVETEFKQFLDSAQFEQMFKPAIEQHGGQLEVQELKDAFGRNFEGKK